jgi:hypothetical protein
VFVDGVHTSSAANLVDRSSNGTAFYDNKDRVFRASKQMLGSYGSLRPRSSSLDDSANASFTSHAYGFVVPRQQAVTESNESSMKVDMEVKDKESKDPSDIVYSNSGRTARAVDKDKSEFKKRWNTLYDKGQQLRRSNSFPLVDAQAMIDEASSLQPYTGSPGDDLGDKLKVFLGELSKDIMETREWIAEMRDRLYAKKVASSLDLRKLIAEGKALRIQPIEEIAVLQQNVDDVETLSSTAKKILKRSSAKPTMQMINDWMRRAAITSVSASEFSDMEALSNSCQLLCDRVNHLIILSGVCTSSKLR